MAAHLSPPRSARSASPFRIAGSNFSKYRNVTFEAEAQMHINRRAICFAILRIGPPLIVAACTNNSQSNIFLPDAEAKRLETRDEVFRQNTDRLREVLQSTTSPLLFVIAQPTGSDLSGWRLLTSPGTDQLSAFESVVDANNLDNSDIANSTCYTIHNAFHGYEMQPCSYFAQLSKITTLLSRINDQTTTVASELNQTNATVRKVIDLSRANSERTKKVETDLAGADTQITDAVATTSENLRTVQQIYQLLAKEFKEKTK